MFLLKGNTMLYRDFYSSSSYDTWKNVKVAAVVSEHWIQIILNWRVWTQFNNKFRSYTHSFVLSLFAYCSTCCSGLSYPYLKIQTEHSLDRLLKESNMIIHSVFNRSSCTVILSLAQLIFGNNKQVNNTLIITFIYSLTNWIQWYIRLTNMNAEEKRKYSIQTRQNII